MKHLNYHGSLAYGCTAIALFAFDGGLWSYVAAMAWMATYVGHIGDVVGLKNTNEDKLQQTARENSANGWALRSMILTVVTAIFAAYLVLMSAVS